jgi:hypothetical protein
VAVALPRALVEAALVDVFSGIDPEIATPPPKFV